MPLKVRNCVSADLETLVAISKSTFSAAFEKDNDPKDFQDYLEKAFHPDRLSKELKNENSLFYFVLDEEEIVGYYKLNIENAQTDVYDTNALEIERIYVLGEHQGKRIGSWMLEQIISKAKKLGKKFIWLGVWEYNPNAIRFYKKHGFTKFGEHPYFIGNDKQTDWLLKLNIQ